MGSKSPCEHLLKINKEKGMSQEKLKINQRNNKLAISPKTSQQLAGA